MQNCGGQGDGPCKPGKTCFEGKCRNNNAPPPPGLVVPIDSNIYLLLAAGIGLGIFYFGFQKKVESPFQASENKK